MTTPLSHLADPELVSLIGDGNQDALAEAHRRHGGPICGLANRLLRHPALAEEVVQEVLLRLWRGPDKYDEERGTLRS
jgi:RNA polymerase sigma-70 factor (ECF subfamily)